MQPVKFGAYLRQLLARKKTSASELARMMGFKSRNTIFRILDEECSHTSRQAFYDRLIEMDVLSLDGVQREELAAALEVSRVGSDVYLDNLAMAQLLGKQREGGGDEIIILSGAETEKKLTLMELLCQYTEGRKLELIISGCCRKNLFDTLRRALLCREHGCRVTVTHYLYMGADEIIANIAAIQPMLYSPCYMPYGIEPGEHSPERERMYRSNCICARVTPEDGRAYDEVLVLSDRDRMIRFERRARGGFMTADSVLGDRRLKDHPIKSSFEMEDPSRKLIAYVEECRRMERNHAVYNVRLDMPISLIHPDMLLRAVKDGFRGRGFGTPEHMEALIGELYDMHLDRWNNYFTKRRPTHMVFSRRAMEEFARTGRQTDHFFALRPFTPGERREILEHIRVQAQHNPHFCVHFFRDDAEAPNMEIGLYEGVGVLMNKPDTDYDLSGDHAEALITQEGFCRRFKAYFIEDLLARHVVSQQETLETLDALIALTADGEAEQRENG